MPEHVACDAHTCVVYVRCPVMSASVYPADLVMHTCLDNRSARAKSAAILKNIKRSDTQIMSVHTLLLNMAVWWNVP